ncbi:MAG TPA: Spy/CpxP family protein refolding chaperone [Methylomirabilota bacterium]|nr:Spy/CpxP family protein refolding chaperone [Methylomirabilota bacterium]
MKARSALGGLALVLGMTLPAAAEVPAGLQLTQAPTDAGRPTPGPGPRSGWAHRAEGHGGKHGHHGWQRRAKAHRFSLSGLALRHQKELALTPAQVDSLRKLGTDARREEIKRQADQRLAELDLRTLMAPDATDPNKPRDLGRIEGKVREIEKLRADGRVARIRGMEQSRQVLTPEQREKLRTLLSQRGQHRGPHGPGMRGMAPEDGAQKPSAADETGPTSG